MSPERLGSSDGSSREPNYKLRVEMMLRDRDQKQGKSKILLCLHAVAHFESQVAAPAKKPERCHSITWTQGRQVSIKDVVPTSRGHHCGPETDHLSAA